MIDIEKLKEKLVVFKDKDYSKLQILSSEDQRFEASTHFLFCPKSIIFDKYDFICMAIGKLSEISFLDQELMDTYFKNCIPMSNEQFSKITTIFLHVSKINSFKPDHVISDFVSGDLLIRKPTERLYFFETEKYYGVYAWDTSG